MTSLSETYLSCKSAMATKLNNKGITAASADDGLTTLINYIDDIAPGVNGLLLSADKSIGQTSDTVNFTALYVSDGNVVSGKSVNFYGLKSATSTSKSLTANTWTPVGCKYSITVPSSGEGSLQLTKYNSSSQSVYIVWAAGIVIVSGAGATYKGVSNIVFEDGILSFTYNGSTVTEDISSFDCTEVKAEDSGVTISDYGVFDTTDSNGVATAQYTCSGAGLKTVKAISGSVVSQPYTVYDCLKYDTGIDGTATNIYDNTSSNAMTRTTEYTSLKEVTTGTDVLTYISNLGTSFSVDFEFYQVDGSNGNGFISVYDSTSYKTYFSLSLISETTAKWLNLRLTVEEGKATLTNLDDTTKTYEQTFTGTGNRIRFTTGSSCTEIRFKNVKCYSN